jgi:hypothetical protein
MPRRHVRPRCAQIRPKRATQCHECHACQHKTMVDVKLCHICHAKRGWMCDCATPVTHSAAASRATRLPRKTLVDGKLRHACHVKRKWMLPSPTAATHSTAASRTTRARLNQTQARHPSHEYLVCHVKPLVDTGLSHACHVKGKWISPRGTPATHRARGVTRDQGARKPDPSAPPSATPATQNDDV